MKNNASLKFALTFKFNLLITSLLFLAFLSYNTYESLSVTLFSILAALSTAATLYIIYYIVFKPLSFLFAKIYYLSVLVFIVSDIALIVDFFIYRIWKFHIDAMVPNILFSPAAADSIQTGIAPVAAFITFIVTLLLLNYFIVRKINFTPIQLVEQTNKKLNKILIPLILLTILSDKVIYGIANMYQDLPYLESTKVIPLYQPMDFTGTVENVFGIKAPKKDTQKLKVNKHSKVNYPLEKIVVEGKKHPNIFIFGFDTTRNSILSKSVTPNIEKLKENSYYFNNNISGGNNTRFGIFALFYALHSSMWFNFLNAQKGPVLFDTLRDLNYTSTIFSSTDTSWPEFRRTAYFNVDTIYDKYDGKPWQNPDSRFRRLVLKGDALGLLREGEVMANHGKTLRFQIVQARILGKQKKTEIAQARILGEHRRTEIT